MESLRDKMHNYEVSPPGHCWEKISIELDDAELGHEFPATLYNMEMTPPATAWEKVNAALSPNTKAIVRPISRKQSPLLKYAVAAIVVGLIAFAAFKLVVNNNNNPEIANKVAENNDTIKSGNNNLPAETNKVDDSKNDLAKEDKLADQNKLIASLSSPVKKPGKKSNTGGNKLRQAFYSETELSQSIYAYEDHVPDIADRYVMLMTPDGNFIRMAKKWSDLLCCVSGEEQDADCKDQIKKWQQKIATSTLAPSPANFLDILGLVNSLQENTEL